MRNGGRKIRMIKFETKSERRKIERLASEQFDVTSSQRREDSESNFFRRGLKIGKCRGSNHNFSHTISLGVSAFRHSNFPRGAHILRGWITKI